MLVKLVNLLLKMFKSIFFNLIWQRRYLNREGFFVLMLLVF